MTSLLTETGFLTNPDEERFLGSEKGQDYLALSIFKAFREYKDDVEGKKVQYSDAIEKTPTYDPPKDTTPLIEPAPKKDSIKVVEVKKEEPRKNKADSVKVVKEEKKEPVKDPVKKPAEKKPEVKEDIKPEQAAKELPANGKIVFCVQLISSDKKLPANSDKFKGLENISEYPDKGIYKYMAGNCSSLDEVIKLQGDIRKKGFSDGNAVQ